jgi:4-amino-4-deoxy-L-arabinose transferase-like glycosyltransferase
MHSHWIARCLRPIHTRPALECACLLLLTTAAFLIRFWGLSKMHFWDENVYLLNAQYIASGTAGYQEIASRPPLLPLLFACAFRFWPSDYAAEAVAAFLNALGPAFLYLAGRKLATRTAAAIAAMLLAFGPFFVGVCRDASGRLVPNCNGHSLLTDCPALTLIVLSFWLLVRALEKQTALRFACSGFVLAMAVLMRFGSLFSVAILSLLVLAANRRVRAVLACAAGFLLGIGPYLFWSRLRFGGFFETFNLGWENMGGPAEPFFYYLKFLPAMLSWLATAGLALWSIHTAWKLLRPAKPPDSRQPAGAPHSRSRLLWQAFLCLWALGAMLFFSSLSHKESRYIVPVAPPLLLLAGIGLSSLLASPSAAVNRASAAALACALMATFWPDRHSFDNGFIDPSVSGEMSVAQFLKQNLPSSTLLYCNENYPDFAYYSGMTAIPLPEDGDELYQALGQIPPGGVLIAYKEVDGGDGSAAEPPIAFLDSDRRFTRLRDFPTTVLYTRR